MLTRSLAFAIAMGVHIAADHSASARLHRQDNILCVVNGILCVWFYMCPRDEKRDGMFQPGHSSSSTETKSSSNEKLTQIAASFGSSAL